MVAGSHLHPWLEVHVFPHAEEASAEHPSPLHLLSPSWAAGQRQEEAGLLAESQPVWMRDSSCCRGVELQHEDKAVPRAPRALPLFHPCLIVPGRGIGGHRAREGSESAAGAQLAACPLSTLPCPMPAPALLPGLPRQGSMWRPGCGTKGHVGSRKRRSSCGHPLPDTPHVQGLQCPVPSWSRHGVGGM